VPDVMLLQNTEDIVLPVGCRILIFCWSAHLNSHWRAGGRTQL
jgi:hypothetical protein